MSEPAFGTAQPRRETYGQFAPEKGAPPLEPEIRMFQRGGPLEEEVLRRRATTALIIHLVLVVFFVGIPSIPGAVLAALSLGEKHDPQRARRLLRWSWGFLAVSSLFYLLAIFMVVVIVLLFLAQT